jgi:ketosteroid isomerase-like protein
MDKSRSLELVHAFFDAMGKSDSDQIRPLMTETVRWWFPRSAADSGLVQRSVEGRENLLPLISHADKYFSSIEWILEHIVVDGDMVAIHALTNGMTQVGKVYENEYHFLFRLREDKIDEVWEILDTAYARSQMTS